VSSFFPVYEGRASIVRTVGAMFLELFGKKTVALHGREGDVKGETTPGESTPQEKLDVKVQKGS